MDWIHACPLGDVHESGKGEKGPWLAKFENTETRFPHKILCVVTGKGDAEVFSFIAVAHQAACIRRDRGRQRTTPSV